MHFGAGTRPDKVTLALVPNGWLVCYHMSFGIGCVFVLAVAGANIVASFAEEFLDIPYST